MSFTPNDHGPIYAETLLGHSLLIEPWNTVSNLVFLFVILYWSFKMRRPENRSPLLLITLPILVIGYIGGTVYHGTRSHDLWRILDFGAIYVLLTLTIVFVWAQLFKSWWKGFTAAILTLAASRLLFYGWMNVPDSFLVTRGYVMMSSNMLLPLFWYDFSRRWKHWRLLATSLLFFIVAIYFRQSDAQLAVYLPQGTHFLWHIFGGISSHFLLYYFYANTRQGLPPIAQAEITPPNL